MKKVVFLFTVFLTLEAGEAAMAQAPVAQTPVARPAVKKPSVPRGRGLAKSVRKIPPAPPLSSLRRSRRAAPSDYAKRLQNPYEGDAAGRIDASAKAVPFYPSTRGVASPLPKASANVEKRATPRPRPPTE